MHDDRLSKTHRPNAAVMLRLMPGAIAIVALLLRLHGLGDKPFWLDEVASWHRATIPLPDVVSESLHSRHYPAYFLLLWLVAKFGVSEWLLRLPSALFGAVAAGLVAAIGRDAAGWRSGVAAGLLLALSPFDIQYGQEARSYTLASCLILVAVWGLARLAQQPEIAAGRLGWKRLPPAAWLAYGGGTAAALNVLNVAVPWLVAANVAAIVIARRAGARRHAFLRNWKIVLGLIVAGWLPGLVAVAIGSRGSVLHASGWAPPETAATIWPALAPVYLHRITAFITFDLMPAAVPGLAVVIAGLAAYGAWRLRREPGVLAVIGGGALLPPLLLLLVSLMIPVLVPRYLAWSAGPFFILAGAAAGWLAGWRYAAALAVVVAACLVNVAPYYRDETKPRWDLVAAKLAADARQGDVVLLNSWYAHYVLSAFAARRGLDDRRLTLTWEPADAARLAPGHALWVALGRAGQGGLTVPPDYEDFLARLGPPDTEDRIGNHIILWRFDEAHAMPAAYGPHR